MKILNVNVKIGKLHFSLSNGSNFNVLTAQNHKVEVILPKIKSFFKSFTRNLSTIQTLILQLSLKRLNIHKNDKTHFHSKLQNLKKPSIDITR